MNKIYRGLTISIIAIFIIIISGFAIYKLMVNENRVQTALVNSGYVSLTYERMEDHFADYVSPELSEKLIDEEQIETDIEKYITIFFEQDERVFEKALEAQKIREFEQIITDYLTEQELEVDASAVNSLSSLLAKKYMNIIFPVYELEMVETYYHQANRLITNSMIVFILSLVAIVNYLFHFKKRANIAEGFLWATIFFVTITTCLIFFQPAYFSENVTNLLFAIRNQLIIINVLIIIILGAITGLAYYDEFKRRII